MRRYTKIGLITLLTVVLRIVTANAQVPSFTDTNAGQTRDQLSALMNQIRQMPTPVSCLSPQDRTARVAELEQKQLELERAEEAMIMRAAGDGIELLRRPDASPLAVLGLTVAAKASAAQVA